MNDDQEPEIDDEGREWFSTEHRDAPTDRVPPTRLDRAQQRRTWCDISKRHEAGETFYLVHHETTYDVDDLPNAQRTVYEPIDSILPPPDKGEASS